MFYLALICLLVAWPSVAIYLAATKAWKHSAIYIGSSIVLSWAGMWGFILYYENKSIETGVEIIGGPQFFGILIIEYMLIVGAIATGILCSIILCLRSIAQKSNSEGQAE